MIKRRIDIDAGENRRVIVAKPLWDYPVTRGTILLHHGAYLDGDKKGLSGVFYEILQERNRLNEKFEMLGAKVSAQNALSKSFVHFAFLNVKIKKSFETLAEYISLPEFTLKDLEIAKKKRINRIAISEEDPEYIISRAVHRILYRGSELANSVYGEKDGIKSITLKDIERFYSEIFLRSHVDIIVVSSYNTRKIIDFARKIINHFEGSFLKIPRSPAEYEPKNIRLFKENIANAYLSYFTPVSIRNEKNYLSLKLLSYILGEGSFNARLLNRLREELGLVYYATSELNRGFIIKDKYFPGFFEVVAETGMENVEEVSLEIEKIRNEILSGKIMKDELDMAKNYYIGMEKRRGETYREVLNTILTERIYKLERNYYVKLIDRIREIELKDIENAAALLNTHRFSRIVLEGKK